MFFVRAEGNFCAAHFLSDYNGKCENLHGHNYKVFVCVAGSELDSGGMLLDFAVLKNALNAVLKKLDHKNLNDFDFFSQNPSAEKIAKYIFDEILCEFKKCDLDLNPCESNPKKTHLAAVDVFETEKNCARYCCDFENQKNFLRI